MLKVCVVRLLLRVVVLITVKLILAKDLQAPLYLQT